MADSDRTGIEPGKSDTDTGKSGVEGEGSYSGAKQYNDATRRFVEQGKVEDAAAHAAPDNSAEAAEMAAAEQAGKRRAKEEDPALSGAPMPEDEEGADESGGGDAGGDDVSADRPDAGDLE